MTSSPAILCIKLVSKCMDRNDWCEVTRDFNQALYCDFLINACTPRRAPSHHHPGKHLNIIHNAMRVGHFNEVNDACSYVQWLFGHVGIICQHPV